MEKHEYPQPNVFPESGVEKNEGSPIQRFVYADQICIWNKGKENKIRKTYLLTNGELFPEDKDELEKLGKPDEVTFSHEQKVLARRNWYLDPEQQQILDYTTRIDHVFTEKTWPGLVTSRGWEEPKNDEDFLRGRFREPYVLLSKAHLGWLAVSEDDIAWLGDMPEDTEDIVKRIILVEEEAEKYRQRGEPIPDGIRAILDSYVPEMPPTKQKEVGITEEGMPADLLERLKNSPDLLTGIKNRYAVAARFIELLNKQFPVIEYLVTGSTANPEKIRPGKLTRKPTSFVDLKENCPSDIDVLICIDGEPAQAQRTAEVMARNLMMDFGYFVHVQVFDEDSLREAAENISEDEWFRGARELWQKVGKGKSL